MLVEHIFYTAAVAMAVGALFVKYTGKDPSILVILMTYLPDVDYTEVLGLCNKDFICHGALHNITFVVIASLVIAIFLLNFNYIDAVICIFIGGFAHLIEDIIVYKDAYPVLSPLSNTKFGLGILPWTRDITIGNIPIANAITLTIGILLFIAAIVIRTHYDKTWFEKFRKMGQ